MKNYSVGIIGCGSIGASKDDFYDSPTTDAVLTHAHAFYKHPRTELAIMIDTDTSKAMQAQHKWHVPFAVPSLTDINTHECSPDIFIVSSPTETHYAQLLQIANLKPKLVVCEKPFCSSLKEAQEIHEHYANKKIPLLVNYIRRFDPISNDILNRIKHGGYGEVYHARCLYGRGLKRDGCHALDIFNWVFGEVKGMIYNSGIIDHEQHDPSRTVHLKYDKCGDVCLIPVDSKKYGIFELDFATEKGIIRLTDWGKTVQHFKVEQEQTYGQYNALSPSATKKTTGLTQAMLYMADNCVNFLDGKEPLKCTSEDAIKVWQILDMVR